LLPADETLKPAGAIPPHWIDKNLYSRLAYRLHIDERTDPLNVLRIRVEFHNLPRRQAGGKLHPFYPVKILRNKLFDPAQPLRRYRPTVFVAHLEPVVAGRVMARGNIDRRYCVPRPDAEGNHRRRNSPSAEMDRDPVRGKDLGRGGRKMFRVEATVAADHTAPRNLHRAPLFL